MLARTADPAQIWRNGQNWPCYLAQPFHALFARISCNTFLESLKHTDQPWVGSVVWAEILSKTASAYFVNQISFILCKQVEMKIHNAFLDSHLH